MNFFIVDPTQRLESTNFYWETNKLLRRLKKLPNILIGYILSFIVYLPHLAEAKENRRAAREAMKNEISGWVSFNMVTLGM